jgi:phage baseplate assembly protein W
MSVSFKDHYIGFLGHPKFIVNKIIEDDPIRVIVQKYEMLIFTNKGELLGDPDFGCDLYKLLFQTKISASNVKNTIIQQINKYIPEIAGTGYTLEVSFVDNPERYQEIMVVDFQLTDYKITAVIS